MTGRLSVVATPIGNLEDLTLRALRVLRECDGILAEDTRRTRILCQHHAIATPLSAFHAHSSEARLAQLVEQLASGAHLALVTDAGTPLVSDPGAHLVAAAARAGVRVEPVPGPSAPLAALSASGLRVGAFRFVGFLPRSGRERREEIARLLAAPEATVLFESPHRVAATLRELADHAPDRPAAVCRELTKLHEEIARGTLAELAARYAEGTRGELTVVVEGAVEAGPRTVDPTDAAARAAALLGEGLRTKEAARRLAEELGMVAREAYALVMTVASEGDERALADEAEEGAEEVDHDVEDEVDERA